MLLEEHEEIDFPYSDSRFSLDQVYKYLTKLGKSEVWQKEFTAWMIENYAVDTPDEAGLNGYIYQGILYQEEEVQQEALFNLTGLYRAKKITKEEYTKRREQALRLSWDTAAKEFLSGHIEEFDDVYAARKSIKQRNKETGINLDI